MRCKVFVTRMKLFDENFLKLSGVLNLTREGKMLVNY